ncbi:hypothetical protein ERJ75_001548100 [Trypanosoma vivax]|nr:hypothetical protein ERJ75_001548100 [Trypanosoma vivax]
MHDRGDSTRRAARKYGGGRMHQQAATQIGRRTEGFDEHGSGQALGADMAWLCNDPASSSDHGVRRNTARNADVPVRPRRHKRHRESRRNVVENAKQKRHGRREPTRRHERPTQQKLADHSRHLRKTRRTKTHSRAPHVKPKHSRED